MIFIYRFEIVEVTPDNIYKTGNICGHNTKYDTGNHIKAQWYCQRYKEGLRIKLSINQDRIVTGMIEYVPGEYTWRTLNAKNYMVIHCLDVFSGHKRKGYGSALLNECIKDSAYKNGIAIVTSSKPWVADKRFFLQNGFKKIDTAPPYYELLVKQNTEGAESHFNKGWEERALKYGDGITVLFSDQCPIIDYALTNLKSAAAECNMPIRFVKIEDHIAAQNAPCPYGTFCIIADGKFLTHRIFDKEHYVNILRSRAVI